MKRIIAIAILLGTLLLAVACGGAAQPTAAPAQPPPLAEAPGASGGNAQGGGATDSSGGNAAPAGGLPAQSATDRLIVYTGTISLEVKDTNEAIARINDILKANQGYIASRSLVSYGENQQRGSITIRVPAAALDVTLSQIKALGLKVLREDSKSNDVTEEYTDLDARRKNLEAYEVELTKLLDTVRERTGKAEDILSVYNQLTQVRGQIEQIKGRQNYLQNTSALATYTVELVPHEAAPATVEGVWDPGVTVRQSVRLLVQALQVLADIGIRLVLFIIPVLLIIALPILVLFWIVRQVRRNRGVKKPVPTQTAP